MSTQEHTNVTLELIDEYEGQVDGHTFIIESGNMSTMIYLSNANITKEKWEEFVNVVKSKSDGRLQYCNSNGNISIVTRNGKVYFTVSKYGAEGAGNILITVNTDDCVAAFENVLQSFSSLTISK